MKTLSLTLLIFLFASCKEAGENRVLRQYLGKGRSNDTSHIGLPFVYSPAPMLPISSTPFYSIEEKKLDTVIALLKEQNKLLKKFKYGNTITNR